MLRTLPSNFFDTPRQVGSAWFVEPDARANHFLPGRGSNLLEGSSIIAGYLTQQHVMLDSARYHCQYTKYLISYTGHEPARALAPQ
jgi:hypothetical protein